MSADNVEQFPGFQKPVWPEPVDFLADSDLTGAPMLEGHHIPAALWGFVNDTASRMGVDPVAVAVSALVTCASAMTDDWELQPKKNDHTFTVQPRIWGAIVGDPSVMKSPIIAACTKPIDKLDAEARKCHADDARKYKIDHKAWKDAGADPSIEPRYPKLERRMVESTTVEALSEALRDDEEAKQFAPARKVLIRQDEMSEFFANLDRYSAGGKGGGDRGGLSPPIQRRPIHRRSHRARLLLGVELLRVLPRGASSPVPFRPSPASPKKDGLLTRFIYCVSGPQTEGEDRKPDDEALRRYYDLIPALTALTPAPGVNGVIRPVVLHQDAHSYRIEIELRARVLAAMPDTSMRLKAIYGKLPGLFSRLALVFHLIEGGRCSASDRADDVSPGAGRSGRRGWPPTSSPTSSCRT